MIQGQHAEDWASDQLIDISPDRKSSEKCKLVRKPYANLSDTLVKLSSVPKYLQIFPGPPGAQQSALKLCKSIIKCS